MKIDEQDLELTSKIEIVVTANDLSEEKRLEIQNELGIYINSFAQCDYKVIKTTWL
jgi:hypothetical protein